MAERPNGSEVVLCIRCGGVVAPDLARGELACGSCGARTAPPHGAAAVPRHDVATALAHADLGVMRDLAPGAQTVACGVCGAVSTTTELATVCPFCDGPLAPDVFPQGEHVPDAVAPFSVDHAAARAAVRQSFARRLLAPAELPRALEGQRLQAVYLPHWTFSLHATAVYRGERGDASVHREPRVGRYGRITMHPVRTVRWRRKHGHVRAALADFTVCASTSLPQELANALAPWPQTQLVPFSPLHLRGMLAERYRIDLRSAYALACDEAERSLVQAARRDLGGDEQRVLHLSPKIDGATFRLLLLPLWLSTFRYRGKLYHLAVNGQTGRVAAATPLCRKKLAVLAAVVVLVAAAVAWLALRRAPAAPGAVAPVLVASARLGAEGGARPLRELGIVGAAVEPASPQRAGRGAVASVLGELGGER